MSTVPYWLAIARVRSADHGRAPVRRSAAVPPRLSANSVSSARRARSAFLRPRSTNPHATAARTPTQSTKS
ncbi:hypothetical protein SK854_16460 [Lentzea sp. BCCO 10_0061]|uniref:Uncharacterized protein n=1 Tax=Lentzea sokolovensis TaxID=3095429 RepID=A0ABU4UW85_9PSEU|nr:hypothetical protein [Lentzea sp. BCCO 10_0061]MDX8143721.1 hypothetical protein [Lentzea sp. BCCO 10_0061]